jgi:hypothetical protein
LLFIEDIDFSAEKLRLYSVMGLELALVLAVALVLALDVLDLVILALLLALLTFVLALTLSTSATSRSDSVTGSRVGAPKICSTVLEFFGADLAVSASTGPVPA